ncbi:MAG TPA: AraC family transcriptional regulator [Casimicrobiaceae bacterium]
MNDRPHNGPSARTLAQAADWGAWEVVCRLGPQDRSFEERHDFMSIAAVVGGTFEYRGATGRALLYPGSFLLGNAGACFECGHSHGVGDRCIAFGFAPELFEEIAASAAGSSRYRFDRAMLPVVPAMTPALVDAEACAAMPDASVVEELAVSVAERVVRTLRGTPASRRAPSGRDGRRIADVVRFIDAHCVEALDLATLAARAHMSRYHFLRTFRHVVGMTPHRYVTHARLRWSAVRLRNSRAPIAEVAADAGFGDLSTFHARFRAAFGTTPGRMRNSTLTPPSSRTRGEGARRAG